MFFRSAWFFSAVAFFSFALTLADEDVSEDVQETSLPCLKETILVDPFFSPYFGVNNLLFAQQSMQKIEDMVVPKNNFEPDSTLNRFGRLIELAAYDMLNSFAGVVQHEVFGHGYRIRSLGNSKAVVTGYYLEPFQGGTSFRMSEALTAGEATAITVAGLEAQEIFAQTLKQRWMACGRVNPRQGSLYVMNRLTPINYALVDMESELQVDDHVNGHDIKAYARNLNLLYPGLNMTQGRLLRLSLFNLVDPTLYNVYYSAVRYFLFGEDAAMWRLHIGSVQYAPMLTMHFAPYGPELAVVNLLEDQHRRMYRFYVKGGGVAGTLYGGLGCEIDPIWTGNKCSLSALFDVWSQPNFIDTSSAVLMWYKMPRDPLPTPMFGRIFGVHIGGMLRWEFSQESGHGLLIQGGYKTAGYLPGYSLSSDPYIRIGFSFPY